MTEQAENNIHRLADRPEASLTGALLENMIQRGVLTNEQARQVLDDLLSQLPDGDPFRTLVEQLKERFPDGAAQAVRMG